MEGHVFAGFSLPLLSLVVKQTVLDLFGELGSLEVASMVRSMIANLSISSHPWFFVARFPREKIPAGFFHFHYNQAFLNLRNLLI